MQAAGAAGSEQGPWLLEQVAALPSEPSRASATCGLLVFCFFWFFLLLFWCWESSEQRSRAAWMCPAG